MSSWKILLLLGSIVLGAFVAMPWRSDIDVLNAEVISTQSQLVLSQNKLKELQEAKAISEESPDEVLSLVPRTKDQSGVIRILETAARENGFGVTQMNFSERNDTDMNANVLSVNVVAEGNRNTLKDFLSTIERSERFLLVETMSVKRIGDDESNRATVSMAVQAFANALE